MNTSNIIFITLLIISAHFSCAVKLEQVSNNAAAAAPQQGGFLSNLFGGENSVLKLWLMSKVFGGGLPRTSEQRRRLLKTLMLNNSTTTFDFSQHHQLGNYFKDTLRNIPQNLHNLGRHAMNDLNRRFDYKGERFNNKMDSGELFVAEAIRNRAERYVRHLGQRTRNINMQMGNILSDFNLESQEQLQRLNNDLSYLSNKTRLDKIRLEQKLQRERAYLQRIQNEIALEKNIDTAKERILETRVTQANDIVQNDLRNSNQDLQQARQFGADVRESVQNNLRLRASQLQNRANKYAYHANIATNNFKNSLGLPTNHVNPPKVAVVPATPAAAPAATTGISLGQVDPNAQPVDTTVDPNAQPVDPNAQPVDPNVQPVDTTVQPVDTTVQPVDPNAQPVVATTTVDETTQIQPVTDQQQADQTNQNTANEAVNAPVAQPAQ